MTDLAPPTRMRDAAGLQQAAITNVVLIALFVAAIPFDFVRLALFAFGIEPPLIDGLYYVAYIGAGLAAGLLMLMLAELYGSAYGFVLAALIFMLFVAPILGGILARPQHAIWVPLFLLQAVGNLAFAAIGYFHARRGLPFAVVVGAWGTMAVLSAPALAEMVGAQFGAGTAFARAGMHITLGDHFMVVTLLAIAMLRTLNMRLLMFAIGFVFLVAIGSRTALYAYALALPVIVFFGSGRRPLWAILVLATLVLGGGTLAFIGLVSTEAARETRMFSFFTDGFVDSAWQGRVDTLRQGVIDIIENPLFGKFGSDIDRFGTIGYYIHNYLEVWRQFGIIPFALIVYLVIQSGIVALHPRAGDDPRLIFTILVLFVPVLVQIALSRSYGYPQVFIVFGMVAFIYAERLRASRRTMAPRAARAGG